MWNERRAVGEYFQSTLTGIPPLTRYNSPITRILIASRRLKSGVTLTPSTKIQSLIDQKWAFFGHLSPTT
jgi:hypothetical protein